MKKSHFNIRNEIRELVAETGGIPVSEVLDSATLSSLEFDSLDVFELGISIQNNYDLELPREMLHPDLTINDIIKYLNSNLD